MLFKLDVILIDTFGIPVAVRYDLNFELLSLGSL